MPLGFGFGVGDFIIVGELAWKLYKRCRDAPQSYYNISHELLSLHAVLQESQEVFASENPTSDREQRLTTVLNGCKDLLEELEGIVQKYEGLGKQAKRTWDRMQWNAKEIEEIRVRMVNHTNMLSAFLLTSQTLVIRRLDTFMREFCEGQAEGSVVSALTEDSFHDENVQWQAVLRELDEHGITADMFEANKDFIIAWFEKAVHDEAFQEVHGSSRQLSSGVVDPNQTHQATPTHSHDNDTHSKSVQFRSKPKARNHRNTIPRLAKFLLTVSLGPGYALMRAIKNQDSNTVEAILGKLNKANSLVKIDLQSAILAAAEHPNGASIQLLIKFGAGVNARSPETKRTPLEIAMGAFRTTDSFDQNEARLVVCDMLIKAGGDQSNQQLSALKFEDKIGMTENNSDSKVRLHPLIVWASSPSEHMEVWKCLIEAGANLNYLQKNSNGLTPLSTAAISGLYRKCELLLENGAKVDLRDTNEQTALFKAVATGWTHICELLISHGASTACRNITVSMTALTKAAGNLDLETCKVLLKAGAYVDGWWKEEPFRLCYGWSWTAQPIDYARTAYWNNRSRFTDPWNERPIDAAKRAWQVLNRRYDLDHGRYVKIEEDRDELERVTKATLEERRAAVIQLLKVYGAKD